ncbi:serine hydrolase domain-containing protein [Haliea sp. E1-2-M8]|uniref:serine hydrolase domain-containing protein n=1 Tax=Haliea sp. E1-2-M8 TaxID=3064706 RepID=UPI00271FAF17|nr:serine hydrolase domain-containing protein [Haliea sp. E1-2-M8]MDO8864024.1 serine hydrolase domain-containing protein [Haliea sp. E1-2-M8]
MAAWSRRDGWRGGRVILLLATGLVTAAVRAGEDGASRIDLATQLNQLTTRVHIADETTATATLAERMVEYRVPGVSIALLENGEIVQTLAAGLRDPARGWPVNPETLFQAGSISKAVAVVGMLQQVEARHLDLDAPVNTMLQRWQVPAHAWQEQAPVTLRRLASHSAGTTVPGFQGYAAGTAVPTLLQVLAGAAPANSAPVLVTQRPGQGYRYSGGGTTIIQLLLEDVTGEPFAALLRRRVLAPAGMSHSGFEQPLSAPRLADAALPYRADGEAVTGGPHTYPEMAAAGLWTTPTDLLRFATQIRDALRGTQGRILSPAMAAAAVTRQPVGLGLGFFLGPPEGPVTNFSHGGANAGYRAQLHATIEDGNGIAIMTNSDSGRLLIGEIMQAVAPCFGWQGFEPMTRARVTLDAAELERLVADYRSSWPVESTVQVRRSDDRLLLTVPDFLQEVEFLPADPLNFFSLENIGLTFEADESGGITGLVLAGVRAAREK